MSFENVSSGRVKFSAKIERVTKGIDKVSFESNGELGACGLKAQPKAGSAAIVRSGILRPGALYHGSGHGGTPLAVWDLHDSSESVPNRLTDLTHN